MKIADELMAVVAIEALLGTDPDEATLVLGDGLDHSLRQALFHRQSIETHRLGCASFQLQGKRNKAGGDRQNEGAGAPQASQSVQSQIAISPSAPAVARSPARSGMGYQNQL